MASKPRPFSPLHLTNLAVAESLEHGWDEGADVGLALLAERLSQVLADAEGGLADHFVAVAHARRQRHRQLAQVVADVRGGGDEARQFLQRLVAHLPVFVVQLRDDLLRDVRPDVHARQQLLQIVRVHAPHLLLHALRVLLPRRHSHPLARSRRALTLKLNFGEQSLIFEKKNLID